jgi:hypothetical protein
VADFAATFFWVVDPAVGSAAVAVMTELPSIMSAAPMAVKAMSERREDDRWRVSFPHWACIESPSGVLL